MKKKPLLTEVFKIEESWNKKATAHPLGMLDKDSTQQKIDAKYGDALAILDPDLTAAGLSFADYEAREIDGRLVVASIRNDTDVRVWNAEERVWEDIDDVTENNKNESNGQSRNYVIWAPDFDGPLLGSIKANSAQQALLDLQTSVTQKFLPDGPIHSDGEDGPVTYFGGGDIAVFDMSLDEARKILGESLIDYLEDLGDGQIVQLKSRY